VEYEPPAPGPGRQETPSADVVAAEWSRRVEAEYTSAAIAHQVTLWLIQLGAPPDLLRDGLRIVDDELNHSELSAEVMAASGGSFVRPVIAGASLVLPAPNGPHPALVAAVVRFFCFGESVAVPLFRMLRQRTSVPVARRALDQVMRDEPRHRQFGWDVLDWLLVGDETAVLGLVNRDVPAVRDALTVAYGVPVGEAPPADLSPEVTAWGLAGRPDYARTLAEALTRDVLPRLAARGIEVAAGAVVPHQIDRTPAPDADRRTDL